MLTRSARKEVEGVCSWGVKAHCSCTSYSWLNKMEKCIFTGERKKKKDKNSPEKVNLILPMHNWIDKFKTRVTLPKTFKFIVIKDKRPKKNQQVLWLTNIWLGSYKARLCFLSFPNRVKKQNEICVNNMNFQTVFLYKITVWIRLNVLLWISKFSPFECCRVNSECFLLLLFCFSVFMWKWWYVWAFWNT